jgi:hypothetical protein
LIIWKLVIVFGNAQCGPTFVYLYDTKSLGFASYIKGEAEGKERIDYCKPKTHLFVWPLSSSTCSLFPQNRKSTICRHLRVDTPSMRQFFTLSMWSSMLWCNIFSKENKTKRGWNKNFFRLKKICPKSIFGWEKMFQQNAHADLVHTIFA